jgi:hypothetical protein
MHPSMTLSSTVTHPEPTPGGWRGFVRLLWATSWPLTLLAGLALPLALSALIGLALDPRTITGAPAWLKPFKFAVSTIFYSGTLAWLLGHVRGHRRLVALLAHLTTWSLVFELGAIVVQVVRGRASHFNVSTPFDSALYGLMAMVIMVVFTAALVVGALLLRQRLPAALGAALRWGLAAALLGMGLAFLMTSVPTPAQQAVLATGEAPAVFGAHSVGVEDGGPGLPVVGWSTVGGDLRVAHFVGLHGLQVLPLLGLALARATRFDEARRARLLRVAGLGYLGLMLLLAWQALRGQPLLSPDALTLGALAALGLAVALAGLIEVRGRRSEVEVGSRGWKWEGGSEMWDKEVSPGRLAMLAGPLGCVL